MNRRELTALFAELGVSNPEDWAASQIDEGIPQLHRLVFLKQAWDALISSDNTNWIENTLRTETPESSALSRMIAAGGSREDLNTIVRFMQREAMFSICYLLDCPGGIEPEVENVTWGLFATDEDGDPIEQIFSLHESVIETDPFSTRSDLL